VTLIASLDPLGYPQRMRRIASEARRLAAGGEPDALLDELAGGDAYERQLGLTMAGVLGLSDRIVGLLGDPLYRLRRQALFMCIRYPQADDALIATVADAPAAWRADLVRAVRASGRAALADRFIDSCRAQLTEDDAARLLPACTTQTVSRLLPELAHARIPWGSLGTRHPESVLDFAAQRLAELPKPLRTAWWDRCGAGVAAAADRLPGRVLDLLELYRTPGPLPAQVRPKVSLLVRADEGRVLRLLTAPDGDLQEELRFLSRSVRKHLARTGLPEVQVWGRAVRGAPAQFADLLNALPPADRAGFYDAVTADQDPARTAIPVAVLDALPHARRHAEARRMLTLPSATDHEVLRLQTVARLPWEQARPELLAATRAADADERATAYPLLIHSAGASGDPRVVALMLSEHLGRLRNEQDPVRRGALTALAAVPAGLFDDASAGALTTIATDALEARDTSWQSRDALRSLACKVLAHHALTGNDDLLAWALTVFEQLAGTMWGMSLGRLSHTLRRGQEKDVYQALAPWIRRGADHGDHELALALAEALARRGWALTELQGALSDAIRRGTNTTASRAICLWLADPAPRDERVAELVRWDPTTAVLPPVARVLSTRRTDLLDPYLTGAVLEGQFVASGTRWFPLLDSWERWLPRQQTAYGRLLAQVAADEGVWIQERAAAIRRLGRLPDPDQHTILRYADSAEVPLAEAALGALAWGEDPAAALRLLFAHADGDRARVAVYAATRAARYAAPSVAAQTLRAVVQSPTAKVTSRKEALRIAAQVGIPDTVGLLSDAWHADRQHRHVKATVAARLRDRLDDPRSLPILREAAIGEPDIAAPLLRTHPLDLPVRHRADYGDLIATACRALDPKISVVAFNAAPKWYPWTPSIADVVCAAVTDLDRRGERCAPSTTPLHLLLTGMPLGQYLDVLSTLLDADASDSPTDALAQRDRPARRRLQSITRATTLIGLTNQAATRPILRAAARVLAARPGYLYQAAQLAATAVDLDADPEQVADDLRQLATLTAGRPGPATTAAAQLTDRIERCDPWNPTSVLAAARVLAGNPDPVAGLIATRLLSAAGPELSWPAPWRAVISTLRTHPEPDVAELALDVDLDMEAWTA